MPFALVFIGLVLVITGARGTMRELGAELRADFTGPGNFVWWIASIGVVGSLGYIDQLRSFSRWFMALIIVAMVLSNRGFFAKLTEALQSGPENVTTKAAVANNAGGGVFDDFLSGMDKLAIGSDTPAPNDDLKGIGGEGSSIAKGVGIGFGDFLRRFNLLSQGEG